MTQPEVPTAEMQPGIETALVYSEQAQAEHRNGFQRAHDILSGARDWLIESRNRFLVPVVALAIGATACGGGGNRESNPSNAANRDALARIYTADSHPTQCVDIVNESSGTARLRKVGDTWIVQPKVNAALPVDSTVRTQNNRLFSDSVANPMTNNPEDAKVSQKEFAASLCEDPELTAMAANYFANLTVDGVNIVDLNPDLAKYKGDASIINDRAKELMPGYGMTADELKAAGLVDKAIEGHNAHEVLAAKLVSIFSHFDNQGIQEFDAVFNYHAAGASLEVGTLPPELSLNTPYRGRFITFVATRKGGGCYKVTLVNVDDQRIAETQNVCEVVIPPTLPVQPGNPVQPSHPGETPTTRPNTTTTTQGDSGKRYPPVTVAPPATVAPIASTTSTTNPADSGPGAPPNGITPPPTEAPPATLPGNETPATGHVNP